MSTLTIASSPSPYEALPLSHGQIRVLEVAAASGDEFVECTMKRISLLDDPVPAYETISYCWGPPRDPSTIKLNGYLTPVPASSEAAVRRMRLSDRPRVLWIDAICIDQSSKTERSAQVAFMGTVYSTAKHNIVYLGENDDNMAERGVKAMQDVVNDMSAATADSTLLFETVCDGKTGAALYSNGAFSTNIDFEALEALFSLDWFRRLWVLQEVVLASSNTCHWGASEFNLLDTILAAIWLSYRTRFIPHVLRDCPGLGCAIFMFDLLNPDPRFVSKRKYLSDMFWIVRQFEKTELRDSIYSILGLLDQGTSLANDQAASLSVDYTKSLPDVLRDATRYALCQRGDLSALRLIDYRSDVLADSKLFPTWAVRVDLQREVFDARLLPHFFNADMGLKSQSLLADVSVGENILLLEGIVVDEVLRSTDTFLESTWSSHEEVHKWLVSVKEIAMSHSNVANQEERYLAIASTLVAGAKYSGKRAQSEDLQILVDYLKSLTMDDDDRASDSARIKKGFDFERAASMRNASCMDYCIKRRFFITGTAGRVGIGPRCMQPGDVVTVLREGGNPFILRKKGDGYWLLGNAYVHGVMDGEAVQIHKARGGSEEIFQVW